MTSFLTLFSALTAAMSACLLFLLEPMFAKLILPRMGGAANVWIAAMMFYQVTLLAGYLYAHLSSSLSVRNQWLLHLILTIAAMTALPVAVPTDWIPPSEGNPAWSLTLMMATAIGAPFAILSATAPLIQRWFALARPQDNPYILYAFSNVGSFVALIAYPVIVERQLKLTQQTYVWSILYVCLAAAVGLVGWLAARERPATGQQEVTAPALPLDWLQMGRWLMLSAIPSSLMLSTTSFIATDIASIPLLWVIPLGLYLLTFIIAFSTKAQSAGVLAGKLFPIFLVALCITFVSVLGKSNVNPATTLPLHLATFFLAAMACHCELSRSKPEAARLTLFFLIVALGGALGGILNSLVAPVVFNDIYEYPIGLVLACVMLPAVGARFTKIALALAIVAGMAAAASEWLPEPTNPNDVVFALPYKGLLLVGAVLLIVIRRYPTALAVGVGAYLASAFIVPSSSSLIYAERNFYGVNRVRDNLQLGLRQMEHGTTVHGLMALDDAHRHVPLGYYNPKGGLAESALMIGAKVAAPHFAIIGLGAGQMVCNGNANWTIDFYEIDPGVVQIAQNKTLFPFLDECTPKTTVKLGDGRLMLKNAPEASYDSVIVDAFTSDSIPMHLLTQEALAGYVSKLKPEGVLTLHVSNRYFNLVPVAPAEAKALGLYGVVRLRNASLVEGTQLPVYATLVITLAKTESALAELVNNGWQKLEPTPGVQPWTDEKSDILSSFKFE